MDNALDTELEEKIKYYQQQDFLDISDDETGFDDEGSLFVERALADTKRMPPLSLVRQSSSFLGPTPKERMAEFEAHAKKQREQVRSLGPGLVRSATVPEGDTSRSFPAATAQGKRPFDPLGSRVPSKRNASLSDLPAKGAPSRTVPFYQQIGVIPRELKSGKKVRPADNIQLEPECKQLLKGRVIYFYPNDDISMPRRRRIHKLIQLGAAWITTWREDITHVMVDDGSHTFSQILKHLNRAALPRDIVLVKFDPYIPQCIEFNTLLDPTASRFQVKGAPNQIVLPEMPLSLSSVGSLEIEQSRKELAAKQTQHTDSMPAEDNRSTPPQPLDAPSSPASDFVEDSFVDTLEAAASADPTETTQHPPVRDDALSEAIQQVKAVSHLPLDEDEVPSENDSDSGTDEELPEPRPKQPKNRTTAFAGKPKGFSQLAFQCMNPRATHGSEQGNPNARTIQILEGLCKYYDQMQDTWRTLAYRRVIGVLRKQTVKISTREQAEALPFIGSRLAEKIEEIVITDRLRRLDNTRTDPMDKILRLFLGIYGVGLSQANKWIQAGHRTLDDLLRNAKLSHNQKTGIDHYDDFAARIPRAEVEAHGSYVRKALYKLDPSFEVMVMGSYRRGAKDSGDIDLIITKPRATLAAMRAVVFDELVTSLFNEGFLKTSLATSHRHDSTGTKWHGASCLPSSTTWRRLDLLLVPEEEMGAALIYFTGNDIFNRSMRLLASKKGMRLNQKGLYKDVVRGKGREKLNEGTLVEGRSEKKIFEILGVPWRPPTERIC
ncbi:hypothetical protein M011DRAFT_479048 [Sporormia fimetaria CBS 119925]|uniref:DNA-directed DNA polymerase n=1 Tax=Sporormia fimetaria CBS 119925 TaxID=1340428 RepID=A0A6A6V677_9PLEO|nr:hypothetical protein M011DRAFT_479048 [Sporormia fimetaria CBS 119925]